MTTFFIILIFAIIVIYDIIVAVTKKQTITNVLRKWYKTKPLVPFMVGLIFIGHIQELLYFACVPLFIVLSIVYLLWWSFETIKEKKNLSTSKFYKLSCRFFFIPMIFGIVVGSLWH